MDAGRHRFAAAGVITRAPHALCASVPTAIEHVDETGERVGNNPDLRCPGGGIARVERLSVITEALLVTLIEREDRRPDRRDREAVAMAALLGERQACIACTLCLVALPKQPQRVRKARKADDLRVLAVAQQVRGSLLGLGSLDRGLELRSRRL